MIMNGAVYCGTGMQAAACAKRCCSGSPRSKEDDLVHSVQQADIRQRVHITSACEKQDVFTLAYDAIRLIERSIFRIWVAKSIQPTSLQHSVVHVIKEYSQSSL